MELLCCGTGRQAHKFVKKYIAPLVSYSLVTKDFRYYHVVPQFIAATMEYLAWKLDGKDDRFRLFSMMLDEMKVTNGQAHDMFSRIFQIRIYELFLLNIV
jgi:hypothetical protein